MTPTFLRKWGGEHETRSLVSTVQTVLAPAQSSQPRVSVADLSGDVEIADAVKIMCYLTDPENNPIEQAGAVNADVYQNGDGLSVQDALSIQKYLAQIIKELPES